MIAILSYAILVLYVLMVFWPLVELIADGVRWARKRK